jgi:ATP-dependent Lhr-like helicase
MLLRLGDLRLEELAARSKEIDVEAAVGRLLRARRALKVRIAAEARYVAIEDAGRVRDALGVPLPPGLPAAFLEVVPDAVLDITRRYARTHGPFTTGELAQRYGLSNEAVESTLQRLVGMGRVVEGGFRPSGVNREWIDIEVLRTIRRRSLARLRKEIEPAEQRTLARLFTRWQGVVQPRRGLDALLDVVEGLQGAALPASLLETEILPARIIGYSTSDLDTLIAAGEVVWVGLEPLGERDGRIALYLADKLPILWPPDRSAVLISKSSQAEPLSTREQAIVDYLGRNGASFFQPLHDGLGGGYPGETIDALWSLVWRGLVSNDSLNALRAYCNKPASTRSPKQTRRMHNQQGFRSRRTTPPTAQGRWGLNASAFAENRETTAQQTVWSHAIAQQLLARYGIVFRETAHAENLPGGFTAVYDVLKALEESGRIRRGYFAADLGATQFALPAAVDLLRSLRTPVQEKHEVVMLAATDPANPYGGLLRWPTAPEEGSTMTRTVGARVVLVDGALTAYLRRGNPNVQVMLPEDEPGCSQVARALAEFLVAYVQHPDNPDGRGRNSMLISTINGVPVADHPIARFLLDAGFQPAPLGFNVRRGLPQLPGTSSETRADA